MNKLIIAILAVAAAFSLTSCDKEYEDTKDAGNRYLAKIKGDTIVTLSTGLKYQVLVSGEGKGWTKLPSLPGYITMNYSVTFIDGDTIVADKAKNVTKQLYDQLTFKVSEQGKDNWKDTLVYNAKSNTLTYKNRTTGATVKTEYAYSGSLPTSFDALDMKVDTLNLRDTTVIVKPTFLYSNMVEGCKEALKRMRLGEKWRIWVPYYLGYGTSSAELNNRTIEPYTTLIWEIELTGATSN